MKTLLMLLAVVAFALPANAATKGLTPRSLAGAWIFGADLHNPFADDGGWEYRGAIRISSGGKISGKATATAPFITAYSPIVTTTVSIRGKVTKAGSGLRLTLKTQDGATLTQIYVPSGTRVFLKRSKMKKAGGYISTEQVINKP